MFFSLLSGACFFPLADESANRRQIDAERTFVLV
ncbi:MAG: hypothetical protein CM15mP21_4580 [Hyphomicrobiales bacterium]|nr:MAG: hypothetical protein CM15mP21_4580 [Hyphomicrobiales bacterium]